MPQEIGPIKVLIFSFDIHNRLDLRQKLYFGHYNVITAQNRRELKKLAIACLPNLIIFDTRQSVSDNFSFLMDLQNNPSTLSIPVIFIMETLGFSLPEKELENGLVEYILNPLNNEDLHACIRNILNRKEKKEKINHEVQKFKRDMAITLSHSLRLPVSIISGFSNLIKQDLIPSKSTPLSDYLQQIVHQAEYLNDLNEDLNYLVQTEQFEEEVNLIEVIQEAVLKFQKRIENKEQKLILNSIDSNTIYVKGRRFQLLLALRHLISNAHKFTPNGGGIEIKVFPVDQLVRVEVADSGIGIPLSQQNQLFEMFYNGQRNQGEIQNGLGLGLKIAKSVAENHKGCVGFESRPTQGTRFWLELPLIVE